MQLNAPLPVSHVLTALAVLLCLAACGSQPLFIVDSDPNADFSRYSTYRWYDDANPSREADYRQYNSSDKRVRTHVDRELQQKGYREISTGKADFWVNYHISRQERMKIDSFAGYPAAGMYGGVGMSNYGSAMSVGYSSGPSVKVYKEGTVVIDVIDTGSERVVWRTLAEGRLPKSLSRNERDAMASKLSREMLEDFPPQSVN